MKENKGEAGVTGRLEDTTMVVDQVTFQRFLEKVEKRAMEIYEGKSFLGREYPFSIQQP